MSEWLVRGMRWRVISDASGLGDGEDEVTGSEALVV